jgi:hypothetical protein
MRPTASVVLAAGAATALTLASPRASADSNDVAQPPADAKPAGNQTLSSGGVADGDARADDPTSMTTAPPRRPSTEERWYGGQTLAMDGAALALVLAGIGLHSSGLSGLGGLVYLGGGPIVHWAHGHVGTGFGDLGIRAGLPFAGLFVGALSGGVIFRNDGVFGPVLGGVAGFLGGMVGASVIDAAALSYEDVPVKHSSSRLLVPTFGIDREERGGGTRTTFGLAGSF